MQLDIFKEEEKRRYKAYYDKFYAGSKKMWEEKRKAKEQDNVPLFIDMKNLIARPLRTTDLLPKK